MRDASVETRRWAKEVGLDVSKRPERWGVDVELTATAANRQRSRLMLRVWASCWDVQVDHGPKHLYYRRFLTERAERDGKLAIPPPRGLADVRAWMKRVEKKLGVTFRRDAPVIGSITKGGKPAMAAWIAEEA